MPYNVANELHNKYLSIAMSHTPIDPTAKRITTPVIK
jgi:hypothetical protein